MTKLTKAQERWLTALESGEYKQTRDLLRDDNGFCCLGVACDLSGLGTWTPVLRRDEHVFATEDRERSTTGLLPAVREWLSIASDGEGALADMNDDGKTFAEIAKWIRENADEVFTQGDDE